MFAGVSPGQCASAGPVFEVGHHVGAAREDLDMFRTRSGPLYRSDAGETPRPAAAVQRLHHIQSEETRLFTKSFTYNEEN